MESDDFFKIDDDWLCYKCTLEPNHITVVKKDYIDRHDAYMLGPVIINLPNPKNLSKTYTTKFELMIDIDDLEPTNGKGTVLANGGWLYDSFGYNLNFGNNGNGNCLPPYVLWENNEMPCIIGTDQTGDELRNKSGLYKFTFTYVPNPWVETIEEGSDEELGKFYGKYEFWKQIYY